MSEFLGSRISLISKSDIRYVGKLANINSDDSTVSLENVRSFGTEGRRGNPDDELPPSDQIYEYIVFRGTDVKDLRIEEGPSAKENLPPAVPNDPAIVGARPQGAPQAPPPGAPQGPGPIGHPGPHGPGNQQGPPYFQPPPYMGGWGRGGPSPGPGGPFGGMPYPPHPGWFPPGQEFPPMGPGGPAPWNYPGFPPGAGGPGGPPGLAGPPGVPGAPGAPGAPGPGRQSANQTPSSQGPSQKPAPIGPAADKKPATPSQRAQPPPVEPKGSSQPRMQVPTPSGPPPPVESKPSAEEVNATAASLNASATQNVNPETKGIPTGPKSGRPAQILPAIPLPVALTAKAQQSQAAAKPASEQSTAATAAALRDATQAAKEAVAIAMAQMEATVAQQNTQGAAVDNLTKKVNEMRVNAAIRGGPHARGAARGRGPRPAKVEVPDSDFDFATANAKFNKEELHREAATGSPLTEAANGDSAQAVAAADTGDSVEPAYNKSRSFFDNISSDLKDRENATQKPGGREWRGEEQRKNMETFGQGSVDGGYRGYRGGRGGRGRGNRGGRGYRGGRGGSNGYRPRDPQQAPAPQ